jgi:hypothetical protein
VRAHEVLPSITIRLDAHTVFDMRLNTRASSFTDQDAVADTSGPTQAATYDELRALDAEALDAQFRDRQRG